MRRSFDPRFETDYVRQYKGEWYHNQCKLYVPEVVLDGPCCNGIAGGYQFQRPNKGYALTVNDYPYHNVQLDAGWHDKRYRNSDLLFSRNHSHTFR
jgi:hypothetical protein